MTALMVLATLMVPMAGIASAGHDQDHDLECTPETATNNAGVGSTHTVTCTVTAATDITSEVDAELQGVNASDEASDPDSNGNGDTAFTPKQPDFTASCNDPDNAAPFTCTVTFTWTGINQGQDTLTAWIDDDNNDNTFAENGDADDTEGQNAGANDADTGSATGAVPGAKSENPDDDTDVVVKNWIGVLPAQATLDCDDDGAPGDTADDPTGDQATNPAGEGELYTCVLFNDNGTGAGGQAGNGIQDGSEAGISGVRLDAEQLGGANDPDTATGTVQTGTPPNNATADHNDACTTGADGRCTYTLNPTENELGTTNLCFWADTDNDTAYNPAGTQDDGGDCDVETQPDAGPGGEGNDSTGGPPPANQDRRTTDIVRKTWQTAGAGAVLNLEPEEDSNPQGTQHTVTATTYDAFGNIAPGTLVDFRIANGSRNDAGPGNRVICNDVLSNAQGVATCTYTDEGAVTPIAPGTFQTDTIDACITQGNAGFNCAVGGADVNQHEPELDDGSDRVEKHWYNQVPAPATLQLDMEDPGNPGGGIQVYPNITNCGPTFENQANPNPVSTGHGICAEVRDANGQPLPGQQVTFTISGVGDFFNDADGNNAYNPAGGDTIIGKSVTRSTDANGEAAAQLTSAQAGNSNVTASVGSLSATGTKPWQSANLRTLDCEPETAENELNEPHTVICNAKDILGNNVVGAQIIVYENGPASITNGQPFPGFFGQCSFYGQQQQCYSFTTDSAGNIQVQLNSQTEGTTTIEAGDVNDASPFGPTESRQGAPTDPDDACDQRANENDVNGGVGSAPGAPAGQCFDAVTKDYVQADTECDDGVDNDGDGFIDFGDDPGCESAADDSEAPFNEPEPTRERIDRVVNIKKDKHVSLGRGRTSLMIKGVVNAPGVDNHTRDLCAGSVPVKVQIRAGGEWITRKSDTTGGSFNNRQGGYVFKVLIRDIPGRYRAVAPKFQIDDPDTNRELTCLKAQDTRRHRH